MSTIFKKIIDGEIPSVKLYEDDKCISILDINPNNKGHALVIPKIESETITDCPDDILQHIILIAKKIAAKQIKELNCHGYNILVNNKPASGQIIPHLHIHIIPRYDKDGNWFANGFKHHPYAEGEIEEYGQKLKL
ncbi:MAG: HIT family protein [Candidatus Woesearchaeota archaeon]